MAVAAAAALDDAAVDQQHHQLFGVERVAGGLLLDQRGQRGGHRAQPLQQRVRQRCALRGVQRRQRQAFMARQGSAPVGPAFQQRGPRAQQRQHRAARVLQQLAQGVQRRVVGPVQVVQQQHHGRAVAGGQPLEPQPQRGERAGEQQPGVGAQPHDGLRLCKVQADQLPQQFGRRVVGLRQPGRQALHELAAGDVGAVAVGDLQPAQQQVAQQAVRLQRARRLGACGQQPPTGAQGREPVLELAQQPALAQARLGQQRQAARLAVGQQGLHGCVEAGEFVVAADQRRFLPCNAARGQPQCTRLGGPHQPGGHGLVQALDGDRRLRLGVEDTAHQRPGVLADAQGVGRCGLLHARGDVDGQAAEAVVVLHPAAAHHRAGVDAHAGAEWRLVLPGLAMPEPGGGLQQFQPAQHRAFGVVLVGAARTEGRLEAVAGVAQHLAAVRPDDAGQGGQRAVHHGLHLLGVQALDQLRRAHEVQEQHADLAQMAHRLRCRARHASRQPFLQGRQRCIDQRVAKHRALRLQRGDGGPQRQGVGRVGWRGAGTHPPEHGTRRERHGMTPMA